MKKMIGLVILVASFILGGCTRIETGEAGLRVGWDKQVSATELQPGSFNQVLVGDVLHFQVRSIAVQLENKTPQTSDNSTLKDLDLTAIYEINPSSVSELYTKQSRAFHGADKGEIFLMYHYMTNIISSATYKAVRKYKALEVADNRQNIEQDIKKLVMESLKEEKLDTSLTISQVQIRTALPSDDIVASANAVVRALNEQRAKSVEVATAKMEAERIATLNSNKGAVEYMSAMAQMKIAEGIAAGKVNTIVVPMDFKGMVNISK